MVNWTDDMEDLVTLRRGDLMRLQAEVTALRAYAGSVKYVLARLKEVGADSATGLYLLDMLREQGRHLPGRGA